MLTTLVAPVLFTAAVAAQAQKPIAPVQIESIAGGGNPITVSVAGVEQDPTPIQGRWSPEESCLGDVACFVRSWVAANSGIDIQQILLLRSPDERTDLQARIGRTPGALKLNADRFTATRSWSLLGWIDYGSFRIAMLIREDQEGTKSTYTLPLQRTGARWFQTDALAKDEYVMQILDRVTTAVMQRRVAHGRGRQ
jgi:hypothetical protein